MEERRVWKREEYGRDKNERRSNKIREERREGEDKEEKRRRRYSIITLSGITWMKAVEEEGGMPFIHIEGSVKLHPL